MQLRGSMQDVIAAWNELEKVGRSGASTLLLAGRKRSEAPSRLRRAPALRALALEHLARGANGVWGASRIAEEGSILDETALRYLASIGSAPKVPYLLLEIGGASDDILQVRKQVIQTALAFERLRAPFLKDADEREAEIALARRIGELLGGSLNDTLFDSLERHFPSAPPSHRVLKKVGEPIKGVLDEIGSVDTDETHDLTKIDVSKFIKLLFSHLKFFSPSDSETLSAPRGSGDRMRQKTHCPLIVYVREAEVTMDHWPTRPLLAGVLDQAERHAWPVLLLIEASGTLLEDPRWQTLSLPNLRIDRPAAPSQITAVEVMAASAKYIQDWQTVSEPRAADKTYLGARLRHGISFIDDIESLFLERQGSVELFESALSIGSLCDLFVDDGDLFEWEKALLYDLLRPFMADAIGLLKSGQILESHRDRYVSVVLRGLRSASGFYLSARDAQSALDHIGLIYEILDHPTQIPLGTEEIRPCYDTISEMLDYVAQNLPENLTQELDRFRPFRTKVVEAGLVEAMIDDVSGRFRRAQSSFHRGDEAAFGEFDRLDTRLSQRKRTLEARDEEYLDLILEWAQRYKQHIQNVQSATRERLWPNAPIKRWGLMVRDALIGR